MKEIVSSLIHLFNESKFDEAFHLIHPDITMTTFSVETGKIAKVVGKERYKKAVLNNFGKGDLGMDIETIFGEGNQVAVSGYYVGTHWDLLNLDFQFKVRFAAIFEIKDGLIVKHDKYLDTLELLRFSGYVVFKEDEKKKIEKYLHKLRDLGLIHQSTLSS